MRLRLVARVEQRHRTGCFLGFVMFCASAACLQPGRAPNAVLSIFRCATIFAFPRHSAGHQHTGRLEDEPREVQTQAQG